MNRLARRRLLALIPAIGVPTMASSQTQDAGVLLRAAAAGDAAGVARLIAAGAPLDPRDGAGRTALLLATQGNHVEAARLLIAAGADVNAKDSIQDSPFLYAGAEGRLEILKLTVASGADLRSTNRYGGTALIPAAHHGHVETVRYLLTTAIDIDHVNRLGWTALLEAVILGDGGPAHAAIVQLLVDAGARLGLADRDGRTPLQHAKSRGQATVIAILERAGAKR
jgi:ankyrin repeat protein